MRENPLSNVSLLEVSNLPLEESIKDEIRIAIMHGIDIAEYLTIKNLTAEELREYRLSIQSNVPLSYINQFIPSETLRKIRKLYEKSYELSFLSSYLTEDSKPTISNKSLDHILDFAQTTDVSVIDFNQVKETLVLPILKALNRGIELQYITSLAYTKSILNSEVISFLIDLAFLKVDIKPFLSGHWSKEQILEIIKGNHLYPSTSLVENYVTYLFSPNQIHEVIRALGYDSEQGKLITKVDDEGYPLFNEYQMYEIVEGIRFKLDINKYSNSDLSDFEMREIREQLIDEQEKRGNSIRNKLRITKPITTIDIY